jgi:hypothetical protein
MEQTITKPAAMLVCAGAPFLRKSEKRFFEEVFD